MERLFRVIQRVEYWTLAGGILAIAGLTLLNVVARSVFGNSLAFTEELCQFLIVLVTFAGLSHAAGKGRHIRMTALYDLLSERARKILMIVIAALTSALLFYLAWEALEYALVVRRLGSVSPVLQVPLYLIYLSAPLGLALAGIQYALAACRNIRSPGVYLAFDTKDEYYEGDAV